MIKYQRISGLSLNNSAGLPTISRTSEGIAMGSIPGWQTFIDPAYVDAANFTVRNRALPNTHATMNFVGSLPPNPFRQFPDGNPAFVSSADQRIGIDDNSEIKDPTQFTVFGVIKPESRSDGTGGPGYLVRSYAALSVAPFTLAMGWNNQSLVNFIVYAEVAYVGAGVMRYPANFAERNHPSLMVITHSTARGMRLRDGGEQVASNPDFKEQLDPGRLTTRRWYPNGQGVFGMSGLLNIDLSAPENAGHLHALESYLMKKYNIPQGPQ